MAVPEKAQPYIQKIGALLRFLPQNDVPLFHAQHILGFHPEIADRKFLTRLLKHDPDRLHVGRRHVQFIGKFAHKSETHGPHRDGLSYFELLVFGETERLIGHLDVHHLGKYFSGIGSGQVDDPQGIGQVDQGKIPPVVAGVVADPFHRLPGPGR